MYFATIKLFCTFGQVDWIVLFCFFFDEYENVTKARKEVSFLLLLGI